MYGLETIKAMNAVGKSSTAVTPTDTDEEADIRYLISVLRSSDWTALTSDEAIRMADYLAESYAIVED